MMNPHEQKEEQGLEKLISAAREERWEVVDDILPEMAEDPEILHWAIKDGLQDADGNLRDLAANILEKSTHPLKEEEMEKLMMMVEGDENPYASFRAAFALYVRGDRSKKVMNKIKEALDDSATEAIARGYLEKGKDRK